METPSFDELAVFIRKWAMLPSDERIAPDTQFERDLGITGDDGGRLLHAIETHFDAQLATDEDGYRKTFDLKKNEFLFNSEAFPLWELLPFVRQSTVREFTVGELHTALEKSIWKPD
jgi:hypothetical protein